MSKICDSVNELLQSGKIDSKGVILWGISANTDELIEVLYKNNINVLFIVDNFKRDFWSEYHGISIVGCSMLLKEEYRVVPVLIMGNYTSSIRKQLHACDIYNIYNLYNINEKK